LWQNDTIFWLHSTTLPSRFAAIDSLTLHWQFKYRYTFDVSARENNISAPCDPATWREACQILKGMTSLKELNVVVRGPFLWSQGKPIPEQYHSGLLGMLQPLSEVRVVEKEAFRVRVPWAIKYYESREKEMRLLIERNEFPFTIVHPEEQVPDEWDGLELIDY
jgi:hypothetical protein